MIATYDKFRSIDEVTGNASENLCHVQRAFLECHCNLTEPSDQKTGQM